jgi:hypothetical protein
LILLPLPPERWEENACEHLSHTASMTAEAQQ